MDDLLNKAAITYLSENMHQCDAVVVAAAAATATARTRFHLCRQKLFYQSFFPFLFRLGTFIFGQVIAVKLHRWQCSLLSSLPFW